MRRFLMFLMITFTSLSLLATTAEAKRLGGGGSIGKQRTMTPQTPPKAPTAAPAPTAPGAAAPAAGNKWLGPLAGLAIGAGLGALFAGSGMGGAMGGILMALLAAGVVMFLLAKFRKPNTQTAPMQYAGAGAPYSPPPAAASHFPSSPASAAAASSQPNPVAASSQPNPAAASSHIPADFPVDAFLRSAKMSFIRLQAANDRKDLNDIREYTTPEMFAEISMQLQERDNTPQKTDVVSIYGELLEVEQGSDMAIASVRFTGQVTENNGAPEAVDEIWHVQKNLHDSKAVWLLSGIQQTTVH
ncbi:MAG: Tim44-like domain-containing protein [Gallionella sp.]